MIRLCGFSDEAADDLQGQVDALKRNGIYLTELRSVDKKNVADFSVQEADNYKKILDDNGISVWSVGSPLGKVDIGVDFNEYLNKVKHVCELACTLGTDKIRMFSFYNAYNQSTKVFDYLSQMVEVGKTFGVSMCHENEKEIFGDTFAHVQEIQRNVNGLKYVYDPANYLQVGDDVNQTVDAMHKSACYFHIKDVVQATGELVPAGYGDGQIQRIVDQITDDKVLTLEPHLALFSAYGLIDNTEMKHKFRFDTNAQAFDFAVKSLKDILAKAGYHDDGNGKFVK